MLRVDVQRHGRCSTVFFCECRRSTVAKCKFMLFQKLRKLDITNTLIKKKTLEAYAKMVKKRNKAVGSHHKLKVML